MKKVTVLGAGSWGTALARLLAKNGHDVYVWSIKKEEVDSIQLKHENAEFLPGVRLPENIFATGDIAAALGDAEMVVMAVPSTAVRSVAEQAASHISSAAVVVNVAKGLDPGTHARLSKVIGEYVKNPVAVLSGPSHAEEVARDIPTVVVTASEDEHAAAYAQDMFMNGFFRVYTNPDLVGIEYGGALKNVIALAAGISDGLGFGDNTKAALMTRGMREIARLGEAMGADRHTFAGLSGVGDLIVTCTSMHSRNRRAGILLGQGKNLQEALDEVHMVVEGVPTARAAYELAAERGVSMPITMAVYQILFEDKDAREAVVELMSRDKATEAE